MNLWLWAIVIILGPVAFSLAVARLLRIDHAIWIFLVAATILPAVPLIGGSAMFAYFMIATASNFMIATASKPASEASGGDGPAFFAIIFIAFLLPCLLAIPGLLSGVLAARIFRWMTREQDG